MENEPISSFDLLGMIDIEAVKEIDRWPPAGRDKAELTLHVEDESISQGGGGTVVYVLNYHWTAKADVTYLDCDCKVQTASRTLEKSGGSLGNGIDTILFLGDSSPMLLPTPASSFSSLLLSLIGGELGNMTLSGVEGNSGVIAALYKTQMGLDAMEIISASTPADLGDMEWVDIKFVPCP